MLAFNTSGTVGLIEGKAPRNGSKLNGERRQSPAWIVESGPMLSIRGVVRWRWRDLVWCVFEEFRQPGRDHR